MSDTPSAIGNLFDTFTACHRSAYAVVHELAPSIQRAVVVSR